MAPRGPGPFLMIAFFRWLASSPARTITPLAIALGHSGGGLSAAALAQQTFGTNLAVLVAVTLTWFVLELRDVLIYGFTVDGLLDIVEYSAGYLVLLSGFFVPIAAVVYVLGILLPVQGLRYARR